VSDGDKPVSAVVHAIGAGPAAQEAYQDLLKPAFQELAPSLQLVAKTVALAISPLRGVVWSFESISEWLTIRLAQKLEGVPPEKIVTPNPAIAGPILLQLPFVKKEEARREMYATLLATSMVSEKGYTAHPAFVRVIQELTSEEARILKWVHEHNEDRWGMTEDEHSWMHTHSTIDGRLQEICKELGIYPMRAHIYLDNFLRLRLFTDETSVDPEFIPAGHHRRGDYGASIKSNYTRTVMLTSFGQDFLTACVGAPSWEK
jgi:hypothetical protein